MAAGAAVPLPGAQRRDQHDPGQPQLGRGPRAEVSRPRCCPSCGSSRRWCRCTARTPPAWTTCSRSCWPAAWTCCRRSACSYRRRQTVDDIDSDMPRLLRVLRHAHRAVGRAGRHRADGRSLRRLHRSTAMGCGRRATWSRTTSTSRLPRRSACGTTRRPTSSQRAGSARARCWSSTPPPGSSGTARYRGSPENPRVRTRNGCRRGVRTWSRS